MTQRDEKLDRLEAAHDSVSEQALEDLAYQAKQVAATMLTMYGDKAVLHPSGFVMAIENAHQAAFYFLLAEGYVNLTEKAMATNTEVAARLARKKLTEGVDVNKRKDEASGPLAYL